MPRIQRAPRKKRLKSKFNPKAGYSNLKQNQISCEPSRPGQMLRDAAELLRSEQFFQSKSSSPEPKMTRGKKSRRKSRKKCSKRKPKVGKPFGFRAEAPRPGSRAEAVLRALSNGFKWRSVKALTEFLNLQDAFGAVASQSTVTNILRRWMPDYRFKMMANR